MHFICRLGIRVLFSVNASLYILPTLLLGCVFIYFAYFIIGLCVLPTLLLVVCCKCYHYILNTNHWLLKCTVNAFSQFFSFLIVCITIIFLCHIYQSFVICVFLILFQQVYSSSEDVRLLFHILSSKPFKGCSLYIDFLSSWSWFCERVCVCVCSLM